ncbi:Putative uncharacterized transposon-derived protein F52C9.6 [Eumeta japonica]|uniref:Uncharacterized transposon-derived protein F52C9.6 n=1 Tax=Eumeta variegata TaxID=151549 RepID=A0A4C1URS6_EUMVA|nr:Putative uncharacterized transposon-derived protein F52C9.6 [Eumeta japonica]
MVSHTLNSLAVVGSHIFTHGSRVEGEIGVALTEWQDREETWYFTLRQDLFCSVFQADLVTLQRGIRRGKKKFKLKNMPYYACGTAKKQHVLHALEECHIFMRERADLEVEIEIMRGTRLPNAAAAHAGRHTRTTAGAPAHTSPLTLIRGNQLLVTGDQTNIEIERRVANAWNRCWSLKEILKSEHFPIASKRKAFKSCVLAYLTYGCQTWALRQKHFLKLRTCQRGMERSIIGVTKTDRIRLEDIRSITKVEDIIKKIRQLKWRWTGHMTRDSRIKWMKILTVQPDNKKKRGRQRDGWMI